jgi:hypothetical protein
LNSFERLLIYKQALIKNSTPCCCVFGSFASYYQQSNVSIVRWLIAWL